MGKSTQLFKRRHSGHWAQTGSQKELWGSGTPLWGEGGCGYQNISIQVIDQVEVGDAEALADCELYWAHQLRCFVENGGLAHCYKKEFSLGKPS